MNRALVVDDNDENLFYLKTLLGGHGWEVETAHHGGEALVKARKSAPDVVVSDLLMPVMDGYTLLRHWKSDPRLRTVPFVVYTATYTRAEDERLALSLGADAFILKPAEPEDFLAQMRAVRANQAAAQPAPLQQQVGDEKELLRIYSETLIRKLEDKRLELVESNRALQADIAERRQAEAALRESEERFRATFEQAAVGIAHVEVNGRFLRVNDKLCEITGYARDELLQRTFLELTVPEDRSEGEAARAAMLTRSQKLYAAEKRYQRKDATVYWVSVVTTLLRDAAGSPKYFITVISDITDRKRLEENFFRAQRVESLGTLAAGIAHDLSNILSPILIAAELLKSTAQDDAQRTLIEALGMSARQGAALVKQVLSFARGVEGARVAVHLGHIVREVEAIVLSTFPKGITFQSEVAKELDLVTGDPTQLNQVVLNLCVNARDALSDGGVLRVAVRNVAIDDQYAAMRQDIPAGHYVLLEVSDTGCGMPASVVSHIFEPFYSTKAAGKGTGLGLATVQGIVRSHGGFVAVESTVGVGTVFRIHLPAQETGKSGEIVRRPLSSLPRGNGETILVVEDEPAVRDITKYTLESFGYRVLAAVDGSEAIGIYALNRKDVALVITDMMMPVMDGAALAAALRRIQPSIPIIAASGVNGDGDVTRATGAGIAHVLAKPYTAEVLLDKVKAVLSEG